MNISFHSRFTAKHATNEVFGLVFRVVDANPKELILWSEFNEENMDDDGACWSGSLASFRHQFIPIK